jgi:proline racemase/trans-L-3-hydroxyproline dehydratase
MDFMPQIRSAEYRFLTIDSHTMGEPTRVVIKGFPQLEGETMIERKQYLEKNLDHLRQALMLEPRGHRDMFGAIVMEPISKEAHLGVVFMDSGGYLNMCGHGSIGVATVAVETGLVPATEPITEVVLEAPAGIIYTKVLVEGGKAKEVSITNVPAFIYKENIQVELEGFGSFKLDISFGGSFFALVDVQEVGLEIDIDHLPILTDLAMQLLDKLNRELDIRHPYLDITTVDLVEFYGKATNPKATMKNVVIFGDCQTDRSPCGTGTSAKVAALYGKGKLKLNEEFIYESITGSMFKGVAIEETSVGDYKAVIPRITGSAYVTGMNDIIIDTEDPLKYGFSLRKL